MSCTEIPETCCCTQTRGLHPLVISGDPVALPAGLEAAEEQIRQLQLLGKGKSNLAPDRAARERNPEIHHGGCYVPAKVVRNQRYLRRCGLAHSAVADVPLKRD